MQQVPEDNFSSALLVPGGESFSPAHHSRYRVVYMTGLPLREGLELDSAIVYTVSKGTILEVIPTSAAVNKENIKRVRVSAIDNSHCDRECWVSYTSRDGRKVIEEVGFHDVGRENGKKSPPRTIPTEVQDGLDNSTDFVYKILSQSDLLVMFGNTIVSVFSISAAVSLIPRDDATISYTFCDYGENGEADTVLVQCPYLPSPGFISVLTLWMLYFCVTFTNKYMLTSQFSSTDLRFYMACDQHNSKLTHRLLIGLGVILTVASGLFGVSFIFSNGNDSAVGTILVFMAVNMYNLKGMTVSIYKPLVTMSITHTFPEVLHLRSVPLLCRMSHKALFDHVHQAALEHFLFSSGVNSTHKHHENALSSSSSGSAPLFLNQLGDSDQLIASLAILNATR